MFDGILPTIRRPQLRLAGVYVLAATAAGCGASHAAAPSVRDRLAAPDTAETDRPAAASTVRPIATINDQPIDRRAFLKRLVGAHGLPLLQRWIMLTLARQEAHRRGIDMTSDDLDAEYDRTLRAGVAEAAEAPAWTPEQRERFIAALVRLRGWSRDELDMVMKRQAILRKIARSDIVIDDAMLRSEFHWQYDEKVEVRHIEVGAPRWAEQVRQHLDQGEAFIDLVPRFSENQASRPNHGLLPPFSADDPDMPGIFRKIAFALEPGQVSNAFEFEGRYHFLRLERRIPADDVKFEMIVEELTESLTRRLVDKRMAELSARLLQQGHLTIQNPVLRKQYQQGLTDGTIPGPALIGSGT